MATKTQNIKAGIFVLIGIGLGLAALLISTGPKAEGLIPYYVEFKDQNVGDLAINADVRYRGVQVGRVTDISLTPENRVRVRFGIFPGTIELRKGVTAGLDLPNILGGFFIQLEGGDPRDPVLPPGSIIPSRMALIAQVQQDIPVVLSRAVGIASRLEEILSATGEATMLLRKVNDSLTLATNLSETIFLQAGGLLADATRAIANADRLMATAEWTVAGLGNETGALIGEILDILQENRPGFRDLVGGLNDTVSKLEERLDGLDVQGLSTGLEATFHQASATLLEASQTLASGRRSMDNIEIETRMVLRGLVDTLKALENLTRYLEEDPGALFRGRRQ